MFWRSFYEDNIQPEIQVPPPGLWVKCTQLWPLKSMITLYKMYIDDINIIYSYILLLLLARFSVRIMSHMNVELQQYFSSYVYPLIPLILLKVPSAPAKPSILDVTSTEIALSWTKPDYDGHVPKTGYVVEYQEADSIWEDCPELVKDTLFTILGLEQYQKYRVRITAVYEVGNGPTGLPSDECITKPKLGIDDFFLVHHRNIIEMEKRYYGSTYFTV